MMQGMVINKIQTLGQVKACLDGTTEVAFRAPKAKRNAFIERVLTRVGYAHQGRSVRGVLLRYIERMTGLSRQQVTLKWFSLRWCVNIWATRIFRR
jgi:hypothetical protein